MISKIFQPKAPKVPKDAERIFHFASDYLNPDGTYKQPAAKTELEPAIARVAEELRSLRSVVEAGRGLRAASQMALAIDEAKAQYAILSKELELKRRQFTGGVAEMDDVRTVNERCNTQHAEIRKLQDELSRRQEADAAQAELQRILSAVS
ncbi:hypothetical protein WJ95_08215 [Burkholderia ubonensis]|uniref:hypothetical protein n=1 Tax=Burkholderia ubonensis TaxID=101571 RepID=UPI00075868F5|nr:hypothetical protein [Burkholderia ubonensis]KVO21403.1 hypothetical protein WJ74_02905 [Burkholderia ubonensis]KVO44707.1 hypothetical protein WJ75_32105 [Burkholderia ubonensis]KVP91485.1 hypothetical protein WJ95_08215 [Burkholderia ubonensis]